MNPLHISDSVSNSSPENAYSVSTMAAKAASQPNKRGRPADSARLLERAKDLRYPKVGHPWHKELTLTVDLISEVALGQCTSDFDAWLVATCCKTLWPCCSHPLWHTTRFKDASGTCYCLGIHQ